MALAAGTKLGPYEILSPIGAGGMGEVYLARDSKLDRQVAIKVLPEAMTRDKERVARFEREAKLLASLNHPNIAAIHGFDDSDGTRFLVMEYVEGETLRSHLKKGPVAVEDALDIAKQIAEALEAAHGQGVIHRDLKPANIMIRPDGTVKVLDFGLAKAMAEDSSGSVSANSPTITANYTRITRPGVVLGTAAYMSPEQARGRVVDKRTDIWSFGIILFECLTGQRLFQGETANDSMGAIMHKDPEWSLLPPETPPTIHLLLRRSLAKDRRKRLQDIGDARIELENAIADPTSSSLGLASTALQADRVSGTRRILIRALPWLTVLLAIAAVLWGVIRPASNEAPAIYTAMVAPDGTAFLFDEGPPALSPDGRAIVFVAQDKDHERKLWLRSFNRPHARSLDGTEGASYPFWSPDSRSIGFFANEKLKRIAASGGLPNVICDVQDGSGGAWNRDDVIVYSPAFRQALMRVSAFGGVPTSVLNLDTASLEVRQRHPCFLPDGKHFLYSSRQGIAGGNAVMIASLDGEVPRRLMDVSSNAVYAPPGYVLYWHEDALRARPFDPVTRVFTGQPIVVAPETRLEPAQGVAHFTVSANGVLAYFTGRSATTRSQLVLYDRAGNTKGTVAEPGNYYSPRLSHDGTRVAVDNSGVQNNGDIWIYDIRRPMARRISFSPADESGPIWSPNDDTIVYFSAEKGPGDLYLKNLGSADMPMPLLETEYDDRPRDWSADEKYIVFERTMGEGDCADLWLLTVEDKTATAITNTPCPFSEKDARISPDGKWLAYHSNESGKDEVYVQSFPQLGTRHQVSAGGGMGPRWREDGKELVYIAPDGMIMSAELGDDPFGQVPAVKPLFRIERRFEHHAHDFDMALDGQTFLVNTPVEESNASPLTLQLNWVAGLENQ